MIKRIFTGTVLLIIIAMISMTSFAISPEDCVSTDEKVQNNGVINVSNGIKKDDGVRNARFLNMLNHNFLYNDGFDYEESIVNASVIALINNRDKENNSYIKEDYVKNYILDMYGIQIDDFSQFNKEYDYKEGFVYIIPRGYSTYSHKIKNVLQNEDGSFTVTTVVTVSSHENDVTEMIAKSLFVKNDKSKFGYSLISSDITSQGVSL